MKNLFFKNRTTYQRLEQKPLPSLATCIVMDVLGYATYAIPFVGEFLDILWAPVSAAIFFKLFGGTKGAIGGAFNFLEEIIPGLDFIPTFTIMWFMQSARRKKGAATIYPVTR